MHKRNFYRSLFALTSLVVLSGCSSLSQSHVLPAHQKSADSISQMSETQYLPSSAGDYTLSQTTSSFEPVQVPSKLVNGQFSSLWDVIRSGFTMNHYYNNPKVQSFVQEYTRNPSFIENITTQATPYLYVIVQQLQERDLPTELALLPIVESGFQPNARSWCGALGLWQLMPAAAKRFNDGGDNYWYSGRQNIQDSTSAALDYLKYLYNFFNGDWMLVLAAYNSGEGTVQNAVNANQARGLNTDFWSLSLPSATQNYVPQLLALAIIINDPSHYGIALPPIPNKPLIGSATIPQQMSLSQAAKFANIDENELKALNPEFTKNETPPRSAGTYSLNLPVNNVMTFEANCAANPGMSGLVRYTLATTREKTYSTYKVRRGDTLISVSHFTGASVATLKTYNHLKTDVVRQGEILRYPVDKTAAYQYITYAVKAGDTLSGIARKYKVNLFDLMQWNDLNDQSHLHAGERIVIRQKISY